MSKERLLVGSSTMLDGQHPTVANSAVLSKYCMPLQKSVFGLAGLVVDIAAADDFGSIQIADFADTNMLIAGFMFDAVATLSGSLVATNLTVGLGSAAAAATPLATTAIDYMEAVSATGAAQTATIKGHSFDNTTPALVFKDAAATNDLFVNAAITTTPAATLTFVSGGVTVFFFDLGEVS